MSLLMVEVDQDLCVAPYHVAALEVAKRVDPKRSEHLDSHAVWGVLVTMAAGNVYFRPAAVSNQESARELLARWRRLVNGDA